MRGFLFDFDQTLTNTAWPKRRVSERTQRALANLAAAGYPLGICTGRQLAEVQSYALSFFPPESVHVLAGGGELVRRTGEVLWSVLLPSKVVQEICQVALDSGSIFVFGRGDKLYGSPVALELKRELGWSIQCGDFNQLTDWSTPLLCLQQITPQLRLAVQNRPEITIKEMNRYDGTPYFDITAAGVTKALGVEQWCQHYNLSPNDVTGFGDSENDLEFLQIVGTGIALANAAPAVKVAADLVISHADQDGLAIYLENEILNKSRISA